MERGAVRIESASMALQGAPPVLLAEGDTVVPVVVNDTTLDLRLPPGPSGPVRFRTLSGDSLGTVDRVGLSETRTLPPVMAVLNPWRPAGNPAVLGTDPALFPEEVASLDLVTGARTTYPGLVTTGAFQYGVGPTDSSLTFTVRDTTDTNAIYRLAPTPVKVGIVPFFTTLVVRHAVRLSDDNWLFTSHHQSTIRRVSDSLVTWNGQTESPWIIYLSPDGKYSTMAVNGVPYGVPVFDNQAGDTLYTLPLRGVQGAAFSDDSHSLYIVGNEIYRSDTLYRIESATGAVLGKVVLPDSAIGFALALDGAGGHLYVGTLIDSLVTVLVYDATSLAQVGQLSTPDPCPYLPVSNNCYNGVLVADPGAHRLYAVQPATDTWVWSFDLLP